MNRPRNTGRLRHALNWMTGGEATVATGEATVATGEEFAENASGRKPQQLILQVCALIAITGVSFWLAFNGEWVQQFSHWGYAGSFLISLISNATVVLPAPGLLVVLALGANLNPILLGVVAGCGSGLGELSGYLAGATGGGLIRQKGVSTRLRNLTTRYTMPVLFVLAILPTPLFDVAGILAGAMRLPIYRFLVPVISGKIIKHIIFAYVGAGSVPLIRSLFGF